MNRLGKLLLIATLSISALNASELVEVFGLKNQEFAEVNDKNMNRYKVNDNLIISMKMEKTEKHDGYLHWSKNGGSNNGFIKGTFISPNLKNWVYNEEAFITDGGYYDPTDKETKLQFVDDSGQKITIDIKRVKSKLYTIVGDKMFEMEKGNRYSFKAMFIGGKFSFYLGEQKLYSSSKRFSLLKSFERTYSSVRRDKKQDILIDITIAEVK